jgi:signal transduction histidine kinase
MPVPKITPEVGWLLQRERLVAWLRLAFAALAIVVIEFINPSRIARFPTLSLSSIGLFFLYSLAVLYLARKNKLTSKTAGLLTTVLDVVGIALIVFSTGGTRTPFFFYYSFPVLTASVRWGIRGSIPVAVAGVAIYAAIRITLAAEAMAEPIGFDTIIVRSLYLILLGCVFGYLSDFEKKQNKRLLALSHTAAEVATRDERRRIAAELHDGILQSLATLLLRLENVRKRLPETQQELRDELRSVEQLSRESMKEIRRFLSGKSVDTFVHGTLIERLKDEARFVRDGLGVRVIVESEPEDLQLPQEFERELYYVLKEGVTNVTKHSHASKVEIVLKKNGAALSGSLVDDGVGFDTAVLKNKTGFGLTGMKNRIKKIGGELSIKSSPGEGTRLSFVLPLKEAGAQAWHSDPEADHSHP